jgi:hypothetical protein
LVKNYNLIIYTNLCGSLSLKQSGMRSIPPRALNSTDFPSITGDPAAGPMFPSPKIAVPFVMIAA